MTKWMNMGYKKIRAIISGGGTGGHIFPAVSIAKELKAVNPDTEILFVGAEGKMEMEKVPAEGFRITGLPISGLQRQLNLHNVIANMKLPFKFMGSIRKAGAIIDEFRPDIAIGVGGYASAPLLMAAVRKNIPSLIQEQNGFAGLTNKMLAPKVQKICVAYEGMERFFPADKIVLSGNPIRPSMHPYGEAERLEGLRSLGFDESKKHILVVGGSLGCGTLNNAMKTWIEAGCPGGEDVEVLWQCGRGYKKGIDEFMLGRSLPSIQYSDFIARMDLAYAMADVIISRSGASSVSEICAAGKAAVFVPSPNVAEDHQTHNAMALVRKGAALLVKDADAATALMPTALELVHDAARTAELEKNALALALPSAARTIVDEIYKILDDEGE